MAIESAGARAVRPDDWVETLARFLLDTPGATAVGAKRLDEAGRLFSMGEFLVHPKGFHHLGRSVDAVAFRFPEEVDLVAGGVMAVDAEAFDRARGDATLERGDLGVVELGLALRAAGGRAIVVPHATAVDEFVPRPSDAEAREFRARWGFDWRLPDLDAVRERHGGTGLLWNVRFHGPPLPFEKYDDRPAMHWRSYETVQPYRQRADAIVTIVGQIAKALGGGPRRVLDLGCGDGLFTHLFATRGLDATGVDPEPRAIEQAIALTAEPTYPGPRPTFRQGGGEGLEFDDACFDIVTMLDVIEHLPNPAPVLRECVRVIRDGGALAVVTPAWQFGGSSDPTYHVAEYTLAELCEQLNAVPGLRVTDTAKIGGVYRDLVVVARRTT